MDLHYTDSGSGFPVVFVHAFPLDGRMWDSAVSAVVKAGFRAIVPDLPGFGRSGSHPDTATMGHLASGISEIMDEESLGKSVFCGLSMGGYALFSLFRSNPGLFSGLILCDTTADADSAEKRNGRAAMIENVSANGSEALVKGLLPKLISDSSFKNEPELVAHLSNIICSQPPDAICAALRGMAERPDSNDVLRNMNFPVKLIFGKDDEVTGASAAKALEEGIPDADLVFLEDAGHYSNLEDSEGFNRELISYLMSLDLKI